MTGLLLFVPAATASAAAPGLVPVGQIESNLAVGVGVDNSGGPSQGDLYVGSVINISTFQFGHIEKFDSSGNLLSPPSPFGEAAVYSGMALDPANGNLYALASGFEGTTLEAFDPESGAPTAAPFLLPSSDNFKLFGTPLSVVGIAFDSAGDLYLPVASQNKVLEYESTGVNEWVLNHTFTGGSGPLKGPVGVAVDSSGHLWVADAGNERIVDLSPADQPLSEVSAEGVQSLALGPHGDLFAVLSNTESSCGSLKPPCPHLVEFGPDGARLADLGAGAIGAQRGENEQGSNAIPDLVAVDDLTGRVYVTEAAIVGAAAGPAGRVFVYAPPAEPRVESELAVGITATEAKLGALVNPGGIDTSYRFEYGETTAYGHAAPTPEGDAGTGLASRTVWASPSDLQPGTTYHFRVVATNDVGEVKGEDRTFTTPTAAQLACPNDAFRTGFSTALPDCRAYELVTPPNKLGAQPLKDKRFNEGRLSLRETFGVYGSYSSLDGDRLSFKSEDVLPGSASFGLTYLSTRGPGGWSSENLFPATNAYAFECPISANGGLDAIAVSADLSKALIPINQANGQICGTDTELVSGEPRNTTNLLLRDNDTGAYQLVDLTPPGVEPTSGPVYLRSTPDLSRIFFSEQAKLTPDAIEGANNVYEWHASQLRFVHGFFAVSPDGSHIFYTEAGNLYADAPGGAPVQLDASQASGPGGGGSFVASTADGSQAFFTDDASAALTADTVPGSGTNLYRYDFATEQLTDLTPAAHAEVQSVLSVSKDGTSVYFTAQGDLASGATQGQLNPYLWHPAGTSFLAPLAGTSFGGTSFGGLQVSANGAFLAFQSRQRLTGYDNTGNPELYLYDAATEILSCASCNPSGEAPAMGANALAHQVEPNEVPVIGAGFGISGSALNLTETGRLFFNSSEALLPADTNGTFDVYEFEPTGLGSCSEPAGCLYLISSGTGARETFYIASSANGNDVFLREFQALVPGDRQDEQTKIYDARVDGGFPDPTSPPACTTADACRPAPQPQPSISTGTASSDYSGSGNVKPPPKRHKKPRHKTHKRHAHRTVVHNHGGGK